MNIGDKFNKWTVIDNKSINKNGSTMYLCRCECGKEQYVQGGGLRNGKSKQCKECGNKSRRTKILIGEKYKSYTVLEEPTNRNNQIVYLVKCECGIEQYMTASQLTDKNKYFKCKRCTDGKLLNGFREGFLNKIKRNAIDRGKEFSDQLTSLYLYSLLENQNFKCALSGRELLPDGILDKEQEELNLSLDRIDSDLGYIPGNVQWVTKNINCAKHTLTTQEFIELCYDVINHANQQPSTPLTKCEGSETNP